MFYDNLKRVCEEKNLKITPIVSECGGAKGSISNWKKGASPNSDIVAKLAVRLNVSTDRLIFGLEKEQSSNLSDEEQNLLIYFNELNDINKGIVIGEAKLLAEQQRTESNKKPADDPVYMSDELAEFMFGEAGVKALADIKKADSNKKG